MGVGAGLGFASEAEACWPGAMPPLEAKTKLINKTIRITGCMDRSFKVQYCVPKTFIFDTSRFNSESRRFFGFKIVPKLELYDAETPLLFGFATRAFATLASRP
jgi:hypothetical protein